MDRTVERKIHDLGRQVLGGDAVMYGDLEGLLDAVMDRIRLDDGVVEKPDEDSLAEIKGALDDIASDVSSLRYRIEDLVRDRRKPKAA